MLIDSQFDWPESPADSPFEAASAGAPGARGGWVAASRGRGSAWFLDSGAHRWVLRHYRRGGLIAALLHDRYLWLGESRVRAFAEFELLEGLRALALAVPRPVAARYERRGLTYTCDLIMERIDAAPLSLRLGEQSLAEEIWRRIGATIARLHRARVDHADLNAHNILIDAQGAVSVIDFDRGRLRAPGRAARRAARRNLARLHRSLVKVARELPPDRFTPGTWSWLLAGYARAD
jgi:3-deoxy-D-manno-octulosonic acid kinase